MTVPILQVCELHHTYHPRNPQAPKAVENLSFEIVRGQTLGIAGETGSGKTTVARIIAGFERQTSGTVYFNGTEIERRSGKARRRHSRHVHMVFQDPYASLNPRMTVEDAIVEPLQIHRIGDRRSQRLRVRELLDSVHLESNALRRYPAEFSGGQRQRIAIARGLASNPELLILDEPVAALDLSVRAQITNLLIDLQDQLHTTYLIISHDLLGLRHLADNIVVMHRGQLVESGSYDEVYFRPQHEYTRELIAAIPVLGENRRRVARALG